MSPRRLGRRLWADRSGASAVEFGLIVPIFVLLVLGGISAAFLAFSVSSLNYAVEDAARCAAVNKTLCSDAASIESYAKAKYNGPPISAVFTYSTDGCGNTVTGSGIYSMDLIPQLSRIPVSAKACHPSA